MGEQSPTAESLIEPKEPRWVITILLLVAIALLPWVLWLTVTLPSRHVSEHWDAAWVGLDVAEILAFALTAFAAWRRKPWLQASAAAAGTLLLGLFASGCGDGSPRGAPSASASEAAATRFALDLYPGTRVLSVTCGVA